jgi:3',5'-cyclic AMP phosphodiesterase CpdA
MRTIAHISDIHFGKAEPAIADAVVADINSKSPSLVVASGDLTQRARAGQYQEARKFLDRFTAPRLVVPGNHDVPLYDVFHRFLGPLKNYRSLITSDLWPIYRDDEMFVIGLNTARSFTFRLGGFWKDGNISSDQLTELRQRMNGVPETVFKIVVTHHPFIPPDDHHRDDIVHNAANALSVMEECGVDLLLAGHLHMGYSGDVRTHHEAVKRSILSVQAGTATSSRRRGQPNSYNWIAIEHDRLTIDIRQWSGSRFETSATTRFIRCEGNWDHQT